EVRTLQINGTGSFQGTYCLPFGEKHATQNPPPSPASARTANKLNNTRWPFARPTVGDQGGTARTGGIFEEKKAAINSRSARSINVDSGIGCAGRICENGGASESVHKVVPINIDRSAARVRVVNERGSAIARKVVDCRPTCG